MTKGYKKPNFHSTEKSINALTNNNIKRALEKKKEWEQVSSDNKMTCRTCNQEKPLDLFSPRIYKEYNVWVKECKDCENKRKDTIYKERVHKKGLEWNIHQILKNIHIRVNKYKMEYDLDINFLADLYNNQKGICAYSGRQMVFDINSQERLSLDRKDSSKGYIKTNVVWCCWTVNNIKQDLTIDDFKKWISIIHCNINIE